MKQKNLSRMIVFLMVFFILFSILNFIFQPVWLEWSAYDTTNGFYKEEPNTIETIFLGTSTVVTGISPMEIYENFGISTFNLGTEQQPILASYYWAKEAQRLHPDTLKTIVFDVSGLRKNSGSGFYHKALDGMQFSSVKYEAVMDYIGEFWDALEYLVPILTYHDRWTALGKEDFAKISYKSDSSVKGYDYRNQRYLDTKTDYKEMRLPNYIYNDEVAEAVIDAENFSYFEKLVEFCSEHEIQLILIKIPTGDWSSSIHKTVKLISEYYGLDFIDFNFEPYISEVGFQAAMDTFDNLHLNFHGAQKVSRWLGNYLMLECGGTDVREDPEYQTWDDQIKGYHREIASAIWENIYDPCDYVETIMSEGDYTMFIMARDDASGALTEVQRQRFMDMGLTKLGNLGYRDSYFAVIENGVIVSEERKENPQDVIEEETIASDKSDETLREVTLEDIIQEDEAEDQQSEEDLVISLKGFLSDDIDYFICSGGYSLGNVASCKIGGVEYASNSRGLNFVVFDNRKSEVVDTACFDTCALSARDISLEGALAYILDNDIDYKVLSNRLQNLYLYNCRCIDKQSSVNAQSAITNDGILDYLKTFWSNKNQMIFLSVKDEAATSLNDSARNVFKDMGLVKLSKITYRDSYLAVIKNGEVLYEARNHGSEPLIYAGEGYELVSGGYESGNCSSIKIGGEGHSKNLRGINVVIYDYITDEVVDTAVFDTYAVPVRIPES